MGLVKWIKLDISLFNNRKIKIIESMGDGDSLIVIWLKLLILAGENNDGGAIYLTEGVPYDEDTLATLCNKDALLIARALETFERFKMIYRDDNDIIYIENWDEYQNTDGMERIREQNRLRKQKQREREGL